MSTTPFEPSGDARAAAVQMWNLYSALVQQGFTEGQALQLLGQMLAANARGQEGTS